MKIIKSVLKVAVLAVLLQNAASCAYLMNKKEVDLTIESSPSGADIFIEGRNYGKTPATIRIEPKNYTAVLTKEGYGTAQVKLESWQAVRSNKAEGGRCLADAIGTMLVLPAFSAWSVYCRDFKQPKYSVVIPYSGASGGASGGNNGGYNNGGGSMNQGYGAPARSGGEYYQNQPYQQNYQQNYRQGY